MIARRRIWAQPPHRASAPRLVEATRVSASAARTARRPGPPAAQILCGTALAILVGLGCTIPLVPPDTLPGDAVARRGEVRTPEGRIDYYEVGEGEPIVQTWDAPEPFVQAVEGFLEKVDAGAKTNRVAAAGTAPDVPAVAEPPRLDPKSAGETAAESGGR